MRIHLFTLVSGLGWLIDFGLMSMLSAAGAPIFWSNVVGASCAVIFVFFVAKYKVFKGERRFFSSQLAIYISYQVIVILIASFLISLIANIIVMNVLDTDHLIENIISKNSIRLFAPPMAKIVVTPITLYSNFLFMGWLLERRIVLW